MLTGSDGLAAGLEQNLWVKLLPTYNDKFPGLEANYEPAALNLHKAQGQGFGVVINYYPSGPLLEYAPERVKDVPTTAEELLAWAKANPNRFMYARPANSGPGRTFMMGLPYILGDKDPKDPVNGWDKTWAYLQELDQYIEYYPAGTGATMKEFGDGSRDIIISTTGWDINPRALGIVPKEAQDRDAEGLPLGLGRVLHVRAEGRVRRQARRRARPDDTSCSRRSSRPTPMTRAISIRARR